MEISDDEYLPTSHPLYKILNENGFIEDTKPEQYEAKVITKTHTPNTNFLLSCNYISDCIAKVNEYFKYIESRFLIEALTSLQSSSLLTEEDYPLISYQKESLLSMKPQAKLPWYMFWILDNIGAVRYISIILCALLVYQIMSNHITWLVVAPVLLITSPIAIVSIFSQSINEARLIIKPLKLLTDSMNEYNRISRRSILFVQESEVIARGFTFVNKNSLGSALGIFSSKNSGREVPRFRSNLFLEIRKYIFSVRSMALSLIKEYPSVRNLDSVKCLVDIAPAEFGSSLTIPESEEDELSEATHQFAIPLLKAMHEFAECHVSELIREICLVLTHRDRSLKVLQSLLNDWINTTTSAASALSRLYNVQRACSDPVLSSPPTSHQRQNGDSSASFRSLYSAVHSLSLHLQSVLYRVRNLEDKLETSCDVSHEPSSLNEKQVYSVLTSLEGELNACRVCWDEALKLSSSDQGERDLPSVEPEPRLQSNTNAEDKQNMPTRWALADPIIEDEVLEAYVESDVEDDDRGENFDDLKLTASQGREKLRKEKEQAKKMLGELQSVISVRAKDWKKREKKAIRRKKGLNMEADVSSSESSGESNESPAHATHQTNKTASNVPNVQLTENENSEVRRRLSELPNSFQLGFASTLANQVLLKRAEMEGKFPNREETFIEDSDLSD